jgi:hypothetical protein
MTYIACFSCGSSVSAELIPTKMICEGKIAGGICTECMTNVRTFKVSFTREHLLQSFTPLQFQCLEVFQKPGVNLYAYADDDTDNN